MAQSNQKTLEEIVTDHQGRKKVVLDYDEYETLLRLAGRSVKKKDFDFRTLHGLALKAPLNPHPRFQTEDDLWKDDV